MVNGTSVLNPSTSNPYFAITAPRSDGTSVFTFPIASGSYAPGSIQITEYDGNGSGNILAYGSNQNYTQPNGAQVSGTVTIGPGSTSAFTVTLVMNAQQIVLTSDAVHGADARVLSTDSSSPSDFCAMITNTIFPFAADASNGYVLPGVAAGVANGSDPYSPYTGTSSAVLYAQQSSDGSHLIATAIGSVVTFTNASSTITATFHTLNPLYSLEAGSPPVGYDVYGYATIHSPSACS